MTPKEAMHLAIAEGKKGAGFVSPNPLVGCVIVDRDFNLLAHGYHARCGEAHAEIQALNAVADKSRLEGAHVFVTLEPCAHHGRTPPCAEALAKLPIQSVTYGLLDPNPRVKGQGAALLSKAGKEVSEFRELHNELEELCEIFLINQRRKRPFVAMKVAMTLDGRIALPSGSSQWITSAESRAQVHYLRGCYDAVVAGVGTFLRDDPKLNARDPRWADKPHRVVLLDPEGQAITKLEGSQLLKVRDPSHIYVVSQAQKPSGLGVHQLQVEIQGGEFEPSALMQALQAEGLQSLFVEGGARAYTSLLRAKLVDRLFIFIAPKVLGEGLVWLHALGVESIDQALCFQDVRVTTLGNDVFCECSGLRG